MSHASKYSSDNAGDFNGRAFAPRPRPASVAAPRPFPTNALPPAAAGLVREAAAAFGCDAGFVAPLTLAVLAAATGRSVRASVKATWHEPAALWVGLLAESGTMKSPVYDAATAPVLAMQRAAARDHASVMQAHAEELAEWKATKPAERGPEPVPPRMLDVLLSDFTTEAVADAMARNPRGLLIVRDELSAVLGGVGRFGKGRAEGDAAALLELHRDGMMKVNRKGSGTLYVPHALASVAGTTQPGTFTRLLDAGGIDQVGNGMMGRFLWCRPAPPSDDWCDDDVSDAAAEAYAGLVRALYAVPLHDADDGPMPHMCVVRGDARKELKAWVGRVARRRDELKLRGDAAGALLAAWGKMRGVAVRLALVLHAADFAADFAEGGTLDAYPPMTDNAMRRGIMLAGWFAHEAERVYGMISENPEAARLRRLAEALRADFPPGPVRIRDYQRKHHRRLPTADPARAELAELAEAGHGSLAYLPQAGKARPAEAFTSAEPHEIDRDRDGDGDGDNHGPHNAVAACSSPSPPARVPDDDGTGMVGGRI